jgi:AmmeMemoRadiSam system protein A
MKWLGFNAGDRENAMTDEEREELLRIARTSIRRALGMGLDAPEPQGPCTPAGRLAEPGGAFVTLHLQGRLRGCIGYIQSHQPVAEVVEEVARKAALQDPRFPPVTRGEVSQLHIEISLLGPIVQVRAPEEIEVGRDGLMLELGSRRGLLLPQVATEHGWGREEFLENTAWKAGLPRDAWKDPKAHIHRFAAEIIEERHVATR